MYASPAWWGFSSARDRARIEQLINKLKRSGFLPQSAPAALDLACDADARLFRAVITDPDHVLHKHLPEAIGKLITTCALALVGFSYLLKDDRNFIPRLLFKDMYMY